MWNYRSNIQEYNIYSDPELKDFIIDLESRYTITDETEFFNNLVNFSRNKDIPYHGWFKYREGYSHILVSDLIKRENLSNSEYIIDPFCGSGTTLVEASLNGLSSFGVDVNPLSTLITNSKVANYDQEDVKKIRVNIESLINTHVEQVNLDEYEDIYRYFSQTNLNDIIFLKNQIEMIDSSKLRNLFLTGLLSITEDVSDRKRDGNGLKTSLSKIENVKDYYIKKMWSIYDDLVFSPVNNAVWGHSKTGSSVELSDSANEFSKKINKQPGAIIFSPPYANSFDYFESYKMELRVGGFTSGSSDLKEYRNQAVRSFINTSEVPIAENKYVDLLANEVEMTIPLKEARTGRKDHRTRKVPNMLRGYFNDMSDVIKQCSLTLPSGKRTYIVVDQSSYLGKIIPTDLLLGYFGELNGFEVEKIILCRRAKTSGQQIQKFPYLKESLRESIVVLKNK